ncbi:hypothetical protein C8F01DRAFT_1324349 [Mycena amicta]|nr:hypothetical protein C8F01DRAFT_1324349 [Mycena amicta]
MAPRQTPLERIAHLLPSNLTSIPRRKHLSLDSPPTALLQQLDHLWKPLTTPFPEFPTNYPPEFPALDDPDLVCKAVDPKVNVMLEWLGDTVVKVAANESLRQVQNSCLPLNQGVVNWLVSKAFLAGLGLLYGLHWHEPTDGVQEMPSQGRMCDLFEALVGAVSQSLGIPLAVEWLVELFRPWATPHGIHTPCTRTPWDLADQAIPEAFSCQGIGLAWDFAARLLELGHLGSFPPRRLPPNPS